MFRSDWTPEDQQALQRLAKKFQVNLEAPEVVGATATFASIERAAGQLARAVARHATEEMAHQQTQLAEPTAACPDCGKLCKTQIVTRDFTAENGPLELAETKCHCSACRRDFFPSTRSVGAAPARL